MLLRTEPKRLDATFARLDQRVAAGELPTAAIAVGDADGLIRRATFSAGKRPIDVNSNFFLASVTKPIVATAFMQLVEEGRVGLHQPIADFEPRLRDDGKAAVTPWHVLTHTSGLIDVDPREIARHRPSAAEMTRLAIESPLRFEPGTRWQYNSTAFYLLTLVMERISGMTYAQFLDERLQAPLGMAATFDARHTGRPIVTVQDAGVDNILGRFIMARYLAQTAMPGGGLFGTLDDLGRFGAALLRPRVVNGRHLPLRAQTIAEMGEDQTKGIMGMADGEERPVHHGLGWGKPTLMRDLPGSSLVISHGGASGTRLWIDPDAGLVFVFFTNRWSEERDVETEALRGVYEALQP